MMIRLISLVFLAWLTLRPMGLVPYQGISGEGPSYRRDAENAEVSQSFFSAQSLCALRLGSDRAFHHTSLEAALLQSKETECDRLAAHPSDPDKVSEGVASQDVKLDQAIAACRQAVAADPENARLRSA
jgi:hypothetical protein